MVGTSFGVILFSDKLALTPDTATVELVKGITVPTADVRELPAIALTTFCVVVPADKLDEVPVTAIVCPEDNETVPTAEVIELPAIVGASFSVTAPKVTVEDVPVIETFALPTKETLFVDKVAVAVPTAELTCTPVSASCILIKLVVVPTDKVDEVPVTLTVNPVDGTIEPTAEVTALLAIVGASLVVNVPVFEVKLKPLTK